LQHLSTEDIGRRQTKSQGTPDIGRRQTKSQLGKLKKDEQHGPTKIRG